MRPELRRKTLEFTKQNNVKEFVGEYWRRITKSITLNCGGKLIDIPLPGDNKTKEIKSKCTLLLNYLNNNDRSDLRQGENIFAEIVATCLYSQLFSDSYRLILAPLLIDDVPQVEDYHGCDAILIRNRDNATCCGLDFSNGSEEACRLKRRRPFNSILNTSVVTIGLKNLIEDGLDFKFYLRQQARGSVLSTGEYSPFYGLNDNDIIIWKRGLLRILGQELTKCGENLVKLLATNIDSQYLHSAISATEDLKYSFGNNRC